MALESHLNLKSPGVPAYFWPAVQVNLDLVVRLLLTPSRASLLLDQGTQTVEPAGGPGQSSSAPFQFAQAVRVKLSRFIIFG